MEKTTYTINEAGTVLTAERYFSAPRSKVWTAWTTKEALEKWWAPLPWRAVTKSFAFSEGGRWHYYMAGPDGEREWCFMDYLTIEPQENFTATDFFSNEEGTPRQEMPSNKWNVHFYEEGEGTKIVVTTTYDTSEGLQTVVDMGMKEGFAMALQNLETLLNSSVQ